MPEYELPPGRYFTVAQPIRSSQGGQTRALLMRNRLFLQHAGIQPTVLTFDSAPVYQEERSKLTDMGLLVDGMSLLNLYEFWRMADLSGEPLLAEPLASAPDGAEAETELHPDGSVYTTTYRRTGKIVAIDYHRSDGSRYLRTPGPEKSTATDIILLNARELPVRRFSSIGGLFREWLHWLAPDGPAYVISDHRHVLIKLLPMTDERFHVVHLMHNIHLKTPRHWNSALSTAYPTLFKNLQHLDGLVTLTHRHRDDVATRYGRTNNLFVVPNPVEAPSIPEHLPPRSSRKFVIVSRLEYQKRFEDAVDIFARVVDAVPDATLDIYGTGSHSERLAAQIQRLGIGHAVRLRGHDPRARETLWDATGFLMTSRYEGYPLATLESLSHGCPVISYDIKYGPREQVTDGVDGFIVPEGDQQAFADRIIRLAQDRALVASMSEAARAKALEHGVDRFLSDWKHALTSVTEQRRRRVKVSSVSLTTDEIAGLGPVRESQPMVIAATLKVTSAEPAGSLDQARVVVDAICDDRPEIASVPVQVARSGKSLRITASADPADLFARLGPWAQSAKLRLTFTWQNYSWRSIITRPQTPAGGYDVSFDDTGVLHLHHRPGPAPARPAQPERPRVPGYRRVLKSGRRIVSRALKTCIGEARWRKVRRVLTRS